MKALARQSCERHPVQLTNTSKHKGNKIAAAALWLAKWGNMENQTWQIDFSYHGNGINCDAKLTGNAQSIALGLQIAMATVGDKLQALIDSGKAPASLVVDAMVLGQVYKGVIAPYLGDYLTVTKLDANRQGLSTSITIGWSD
jgi:hypothetical protein